MKVIDLLNKIANGEEVPKKIKYENKCYNLIKKYNDDWEEYEFGYQLDGGGYLNIWRFDVLNDEIEIIEEPKKIEKINVRKTNEAINNYKNANFNSNDMSSICRSIGFMMEDMNKLNDNLDLIIDYINKGDSND